MRALGSSSPSRRLSEMRERRTRSLPTRRSLQHSLRGGNSGACPPAIQPGSPSRPATQHPCDADLFCGPSQAIQDSRGTLSHSRDPNSRSPFSLLHHPNRPFTSIPNSCPSKNRLCLHPNIPRSNRSLSDHPRKCCVRFSILATPSILTTPSIPTTLTIHPSDPFPIEIGDPEAPRCGPTYH